MSYSIANIVFGIPLTEDLAAVADTRDEELDVRDGGHFTTMYTAGGPPAGYVGVLLHSFDRGTDFLDFDDLTVIIPTLEQQLGAQEAVDNLPQEYRDVALPVKRYLIWSDS